jgi:hypothetical protein
MANIEVCILRLRRLGYNVRMIKPELLPRLTFVNDALASAQDNLIVRCHGYTVVLDRSRGVKISPTPPNDALRLIDFGKKHFFIYYHFPDQSSFFELEDDAFVECVVLRVQEASDIVSALPSWLRPS